MTPASQNEVPDALLLVAPGCPHCAGMLSALAELVKEGAVGRLTVVNLARHPEEAQRYGVRSVPWLRLGPLELPGARSPEELRRWARDALRAEGMARHLAELLETGNLSRAERLARENDTALDAVGLLLADPETELQVRVGLGAILEELAGDPRLDRLIAPLSALARHDDPRIRNDACHYLGLLRRPGARTALETCREDADPQVREVAAEGLAALGE